MILPNNIQYLFSPALRLLLRQSASSSEHCDITLKGSVLVLKWSGMYYDSCFIFFKSCSLNRDKACDCIMAESQKGNYMNKSHLQHFSHLILRKAVSAFLLM